MKLIFVSVNVYYLLIIQLLLQLAQSLISNCAITEINNVQICLQCSANYKLSQTKQQCISAPNENCLVTYDDPLKIRKLCSQCICGYGLLEDRSCISNSNRIIGCHQYNNFNQCKECKVQFGLSMDLSSCLLNKNYTQNCRQYNQTKHCIQCQLGFGLTQFSKCIQLSPSSQNFENADKAQWVDERHAQCIEGFKLDKDELGCYAIIPFCDNLIRKNTITPLLTANCLTCMPGYLYSQNKEQCGLTIANCLSLDNVILTICFQCANGYTPNKNATKCLNTNLLKCNCQYPSADGLCEQCYSGYGVSTDFTQCVYNEGRIQGCLQYKTDFIECAQCFPEWELKKSYCYCRGSGSLQSSYEPGSCLSATAQTGIRDCIEYFSADRCYLCKWNNEYRSPDWMYCSPYGDVPGCVKYWRVNICRECQKGYGLTTDGLCTSNTNNDGKVQQCKIYGNDQCTSCLQCEDGWEQPNGPTSCGFSIQNCQEYDQQKKCILCKNTFSIAYDALGNTLCIAGTTITNCLTYNSIPGGFTCRICNSQLSVITTDSLYCISINNSTTIDNHCTKATYTTYSGGTFPGKACVECGLLTEDYGLNSSNYCINNMDNSQSDAIIFNCANYQSGPLSCIKCKPGYYMQISTKNSCLKLNECKQVNILQQDKCNICNDGSALDSKFKCVNSTTNNLGHCEIAKDDGTECIQCHSDNGVTVMDLIYKRCVNSTDYIKYCLNFTNEPAKNNCNFCDASKGYSLNSQNQCQTSVQNCKTMLNSTFCQDCILHYSINESTYQDCLQYNYHSKCKVAKSDASNCSLCMEPYTTINSLQCYQYCYLLTAGCYKMSDRTICSQCWNSPNYQYPTQFFLTNDAKNCAWKPKNCQIVYSDRNCSQCNSGNYKSLNSKNLYECIQHTADVQLNCQNLSSSSNTCLDCINKNLQYLQQGKCNVRSVTSPNCITYSIIEDKCIQCNNSTYLSVDTLARSVCLTRVYSLNNCVDPTYNQDRCIQCRVGYILTSSYSCRPNTKMAYCREASQTEDQCLQCLDNYAITTNYECVPNLPDGVENCRKYQSKTASHFACIECLNNFIISNDLNLCIANCIRINSQNQCIQCINGYIMMDGNLCVLDQFIQNCAEFNSDQSSCKSCQRGYGLTTIMQCVKNTNFVENCAYFNQNMTCKQCHEGYIIKQGGDYCHFNNGCCTIAGCIELREDFNYEILTCNKCDESKFYILNNSTFLCQQQMQYKPNENPDPFSGSINQTNLVNVSKSDNTDQTASAKKSHLIFIAFITSLFIQLAIVIFN